MSSWEEQGKADPSRKMHPRINAIISSKDQFVNDLWYTTWVCLYLGLGKGWDRVMWTNLYIAWTNYVHEDDLELRFSCLYLLGIEITGMYDHALIMQSQGLNKCLCECLGKRSISWATPPVCLSVLLTSTVPLWKCCHSVLLGQVHGKTVA